MSQLHCTLLTMTGDRLDSPKKNHIVGALEFGGSTKEVASYYDVSQRTVRQVWKKFRVNGNTHNLHCRPQKKFDAETHIELIEAAVDNRRASLQQLGVRFGASRATIQKELASEGYH